ncbi:MAG TPA: DUF4388 domain-containing protein [Vicinamibacteria bacterium]|nr:DUF4388 domain-containing protein [Vicinamibacteria bacterium]
MAAFPPEPTEPDDDLTIRGEIGDTNVAELLRSLLNSGETGFLTVRDGDVTKSVYIRAGRVLYAASTNVDERLGESLLLRGRITARQYVEASKMVRPGLRLGAILLELGALESEELIPAVEHQVKEILMDLFTWTHGTYDLVIKDLDPDTLVTLNISTENLILEGIRRVRAWSQLMRGLGDIGAVLARAGGPDYKLELSAEEQEVLAQVNGRSTVEQICDVSYLSHFETCRILWGLLVLGVVVRRGQKDTGPEEGAREKERELDLEGIVEKFNQMFGRIYTFLQGRLGREVDGFMETALDDVSRQYGSLFAGVDLKQYGRADFEQMLANVADLPPEQRKSLMVSGLNELVFVIQLSVRTRFGKEEEAVVSGIIKEGFRRLGAA